MKLEDVTLDQVHEFMQKGSASNAPEHIVKYLELIDKVRGMILRFDIWGNRESVISHLVKHDRLSPYKARIIYNETIEYFYLEKVVSKAAWRNFYADKMERVVNFAMQTMTNASDAAKVVSMLKELGEMREVHVPDKEELPDNFFEKPFVLMTTDPEVFEFGKVNRQQLSAFIDTLPDITEREKIRIKQEARVLPLTIFADEQEDPRKS